MEDKLLEVRAKDIFIDPATKTPILFLADDKQEIILPIWIGYLEAQAIYYYLRNFIPQRPLTIETMYSIISKDLGGEIEKIVISDLAGGTFFADVFIKDKNGNVYIRDARPSDAVALALKAHSNIYISPKVISRFTPEEQQNFKKIFELLKESQKDLKIFGI